MENKLEIKNANCVNSNHKARFLAAQDKDFCQCSFGECKVRVEITYNGHDPYVYILTEKEMVEAKELLEEHNRPTP